MELSDLTEKPGSIAEFEIPMVVPISTTDGHKLTRISPALIYPCSSAFIRGLNNITNREFNLRIKFMEIDKSLRSE